MKRNAEQSFSQNSYTIIAPSGQLPEMLPDWRILERLADLYSEQSSTENFPIKKCIKVSELAFDLGLGLHVVDGGDFKLDNTAIRRTEPTARPHTWLRDDQGRYYDLTGEQFNWSLKEKFSPGVTVICPGTELYRRYRTKVQMLLDY